MFFKFRVTSAGSHVHVNSFAGPDQGHLANIGRLCFRQDEWEAFKQCLTNGADLMSGVKIISAFGRVEVMIEAEKCVSEVCRA